VVEVEDVDVVKVVKVVEPGFRQDLWQRLVREILVRGSVSWDGLFWRFLGIAGEQNGFP
jgi:hypothetical protein